MTSAEAISQRRCVRCSARRIAGRGAASIASASVPEVRADRGGVGIGADAERIEDGGDAGGGDLGVVGDHRAQRVPADLRPRSEVALEMIGMELDQARDDGVAGHVEAGSRERSPSPKSAMRPLGDRKPPVVDHPVRQDQRAFVRTKLSSLHHVPRTVAQAALGSAKARDIDHAVGDALAHVLVVEHADDRRAGARFAG